MNEYNSAVGGAAVTPSNTVGYDRLARGLFVGGAGNVSMVGGDGATVVFTGVPAGAILPIAHTRVNSTGTTATNMTAMF